MTAPARHAWRIRADLAEREADELVLTNAVLDSLLSIILHRYSGSTSIPPELRKEIEAAIVRARLAEADHEANHRMRAATR